MNKLLIVGTVAFDAIETPFGKTDKILGGAGTYIGLSASHFNLESAIVSVVGDDFPQEYLDLLTDRNINISGLEVVKGGKTFFWSGLYHNDLNSRDTLATELNVLADFQPKVPQNFKTADVVMLGNLHPGLRSNGSAVRQNQAPARLPTRAVPPSVCHSVPPPPPPPLPRWPVQSSQRTRRGRAQAAGYDSRGRSCPRLAAECLQPPPAQTRNASN